MAKLKCNRCNSNFSYNLKSIICIKCKSPLDIIWEKEKFDKKLLDNDKIGIWRFRMFLPPIKNIITLSEGWTPINIETIKNIKVLFKMEYLNPSGSFKDRGAAVALSRALDLNVMPVVEDSSGNAGISMAMYASKANLEIEIHGPIDMPQGKLDILRKLGATIYLGGTRDEAHIRAINRDGYYIGHLYNPFFIEGVKTIIYEILLQNKQIPRNIVLPIGSGTLLLGIYYGLSDLMEAGYIDEVRIIGVEAAGYESVYFKLYNQNSGLARTDIADGLRIKFKPRINQILDIIKRYGDVVVVDENIILKAQDILWKAGYIIEPTTAAIYAGFLKALDMDILEGNEVLIPLTGSGLKPV